MADNYTGLFVWRELMSQDPKKSTRFYGELCNWSIKSVDMAPGMPPYELIHKGDGKDQGGIMKFEKAGIPAHWVSYVAVSDVDATAKTVTDSGGKILNPAMDIPNIGRFAVAADPDGAIFVLFKSANPQPRPAETPKPAVGDFCWEQLASSNLQASAAFYQKVLGWTSKPGPGGSDLVFYVGETMVASAMATPPGVRPNWMTFVVTDNLEASNARAQKLGGSVLMPKIEVPNMGKFSVVQDDVGAVIGLFQGA